VNIPRELLVELKEYIRLERSGSYSPEELDKLWQLAACLYAKLEKLGPAQAVPYLLWQLLGNIDLGAIKKEYRGWILDDADIFVKELLG
jgi:hypothetical protein